MLDYYGLSEYYDITKEWYDVYRFGAVNVYCPWDVINWCEQLRRSQNHTPQNFWANSSNNDMVLRFVEMADDTTRAELKDLSEGKSVDKNIQMELTYADIDQSIDNLWSVLFTTGYLTYYGRNEDGSWQLIIPNREIHDLFDRQIKSWFYTRIEGGMESLFKAFDDHNIEQIETCLNECMVDSIMFKESPPLKFAYGIYPIQRVGCRPAREERAYYRSISNSSLTLREPSLTSFPTKALPLVFIQYGFRHFSLRKFRMDHGL